MKNIMFQKAGPITLGAVLFTVALTGVVSAKEPIRIGFVASITGAASFLGDPQKDTAIMIQERLNREGGIKGVPVQIIIEDSRSEESQAVLATRRLIDRDRVVAIIGSSTTGESMAMAAICEAAKIPMVSMAAAVMIVTPAEEYNRVMEHPRSAWEPFKTQRPWIFKTPQTDTTAVEAIYAFMRKRGITRVGLATVSTGFGDSGRRELRRMAPKYGITIVADEVYGPRAADMTAQLTKIMAGGAEAIINWSVGPTQVVITRNWKALGSKIPLFQSHGFGSRRNIELADGAAEGVIAPLGRLVIWDKLPKTHPQFAVLSRYATEFEKRFKTEVSTFGGHGYDALNMVIDAIRAVGPNRERIRDFLENNIKNWPGTGGIFTMSPANHTGLDMTAFEMIQVVKGDWEFAK